VQYDSVKITQHSFKAKGSIFEIDPCALHIIDTKCTYALQLNHFVLIEMHVQCKAKGSD